MRNMITIIPGTTTDTKVMVIIMDIVTGPG
jgi:hypothetical protein